MLTRQCRRREVYLHTYLANKAPDNRECRVKKATAASREPCAAVAAAAAASCSCSSLGCNVLSHEFQ